ncbi:phage tail sheath family protein [Geodermatophilus sp. SYSU D00766]
MPEYLAPGVYVEEIERGPKPIEGVATSTAAFLGETQRGPEIPWLVTSSGEYLRWFGDVFAAGKYMPYAVRTFFDNGGRRCYITRVVGDGAAAATFQGGGFTVAALGPGTAPENTWVRIGPGTTLNAAGDPVGFRLRLDYWANPADVPESEDDIDRALTRPSISEDFEDLSLDAASPSYFAKRVNNFNSTLVQMTAADDAAIPGAQISGRLAGGSDGGPVGPDDYEVESEDGDPRKRKGLKALELDAFREVAIVYAPGADYDVARKVITHCERNRFRFAVVDTLQGERNAVGIEPRSVVTDTRYGAFYYPWFYMSDPSSGGRTLVPPGGAVCGIYALTDNTRGVFKAPANEVVAGAIDLEFDINQGTQEVLNPRGVNAIRRFPGRGIRVWGARTMSSDPLWKYVSVRRLFIFLEASIYNSTQWVVFEPNDPRLWARIKQTVTLFLRTQWREGALLGAREEDAFSVAVGRETMTEDDILNGRLIIEVGIAPVRPAEFVVFRVFQKTQESKS